MENISKKRQPECMLNDNQQNLFSAFLEFLTVQMFAHHVKCAKAMQITFIRVHKNCTMQSVLHRVRLVFCCKQRSEYFSTSSYTRIAFNNSKTIRANKNRNADRALYCDRQSQSLIQYWQSTTPPPPPVPRRTASIPNLTAF